MTYQEALNYLNSFVNYEKLDNYDYKISFRLDRMRRLARALGDPHQGTRSIHIAGTKGKGSTAVITQSILKQAGFKVGLYTSPHLISFRERIKIGDELISEEDIARLTAKIRDAIERLGSDKPSFFEIYTALAYLYFKENRVDYAVYEVGLGGRLDATNIIEPLVTAITPLSYEHTQKLGATLKEIATEKGGIIKDGIICVSAPQEKEAFDTIKKICARKNARLILVGKDILSEELYFDENREVFNVFGLFAEYPILEMRLIGQHQVVNATLAIGIIEALRFYGLTLSSETIREGIAAARWDGRLEITGRNPYLVLDGAQNGASARSLAKSVKRNFKYSNLSLVLGVSKDKDINGILKELLPISDSVILTKSKVAERALEPSKIKEAAGLDGATLTSSVEEALVLAQAGAGKDDMILVTGSLFVVGEAKEALIRKNV